MLPQRASAISIEPMEVLPPFAASSTRIPTSVPKIGVADALFRIVDRVLRTEGYAYDVFELMRHVETRDLPSDAFGVFVTVRRPPCDRLAPDTGPGDNSETCKRGTDGAHTRTYVHGCRGFWYRDFRPMSPAALKFHAIDKGVHAFFLDPRCDRFSTERVHGDTAFVVAFLVPPVAEIDPDDGTFVPPSLPDRDRSDDNVRKEGEGRERFDNARYGLALLDRYTGSSATFLPGCLPGAPWNEVRLRLMARAAAGREDLWDLWTTARGRRGLEFFAYRTLETRLTVREHRERLNL